MRLLRGRRDPPGSVIDSGNISEHENLLDNEYAVPLGLIFDRAGKWAPPPRDSAMVGLASASLPEQTN